VAEETVRCLKRTVPAALPVSCSLGRQSDELQRHISTRCENAGLPWPLTFSYSRALQNPPLKTWRGQSATSSRPAGFFTGPHDGLAAQGKYRPELEKQAA